ncbi:aminoglycoside phosphotransferase family protein [Streptomyces sp. NPDC021093]|uniref:aminoglycoside phosphotransferase family protein n=1 Tax=Streptomyces sp. NPDC021093 TaxID=3365112 RepID=UPI00378B5EE9
MELTENHQALVEGLLPGEDAGGLAVHQGQFHQVVVGADRVVCLARTDAAAARLPARAALLRAVAGIGLGFRTPVPLAEAYGADGVVPHLVLSRVPGEPLEAAALGDPGAAGAVAAQCAALLAELAAAGADERARAVLPRSAEDRWRLFAAEVRGELYALMSQDGRQRAARELAALDTLPHLTGAVVHGDLGGENVLWVSAPGEHFLSRPSGPITPLPRLSGVIDWDEVTLGDPAEDLAAIGASYGPAFLGRVLARYGAADRTLPARIAAIQGTFALQQALAAHQDGDGEELADGLTNYR